MSRSARSLRFQTAEQMPKGMRALYEAQQQAQQRGGELLVHCPRGAGKTTAHNLLVAPGTPVPSMYEGGQMACVPDPNAPKLPRRSKYGAVATVVDGIRFDSKREADYYEQLKLRVASGEVRYFLRQVPLHLPGGTKLVVDFVEHWTDGSVHYIDCKGWQTPTFKVKKREVEHHYPVEIELA